MVNICELLRLMIEKAKEKHVSHYKDPTGGTLAVHNSSELLPGSCWRIKERKR